MRDEVREFLPGRDRRQERRVSFGGRTCGAIPNGPKPVTRLGVFLGARPSAINAAPTKSVVELGVGVQSSTPDYAASTSRQGAQFSRSITSLCGILILECIKGSNVIETTSPWPVRRTKSCYILPPSRLDRAISRSDGIPIFEALIARKSRH